jgi:chitinase
MSRGLLHSRSYLALLVAVAAASVGCSASSDDGSSGQSIADLSASQCATAKPWKADTAYKAGDIVSYQGAVYVVLQGHTSLSVWPPNIVPALFQPTDCKSAPTNPPPPPSSPPPPPKPPTPPTPPTPPSGGGPGGGPTGSANGLVFSPYKDTSINMNWNTNVISTSVSGAATPFATDLTQNGGKTVTLAFATGECGSENWGGVPGAAMASANVGLLTQAGVKYLISTGGAAGVFRCSSDAGMESFIGRWASPNLIGIDFDIEAGQSPSDIDNLLQRIKSAHASHPGLRFSLTLATLATSQPGSIKAQSMGGNAPDSFNILGDQTLAAVRSALGFNGSPSTWPSYVTVNLMTMDYGSAGAGICVVSGGACDMGESAIQAAYNLRDKFGVPFSGIEVTPMIGGNDVSSEHFTAGDAATVSRFAIAQGLAGVHYWSYDRDTDCAAGYASPTCNSIGGVGAHGYLKAFMGAGLH